MTAIAELAPGLWRWAGPHPQWSAGAFGSEVGSYALVTDDALLLVDPLVPEGAAGEALLASLDGLAGDLAVHVLITIAYHLRSAEPLCDRYGAPLWGPLNLAPRLGEPGRLRELYPDADGPAGVRAFAIGKPVRRERPLWFPSHRAVVFGDAVVRTPDGELRMWSQERLDDRRRTWFADRFAPTLEPIAEQPVDHVLVTHGEPVIGAGAAKLREAIEAAPWFHTG